MIVYCVVESNVAEPDISLFSTPQDAIAYLESTKDEEGVTPFILKATDL